VVQKLIILGCGGNALDLFDIVDAINRVTPTWQVDGFLDDRREQDSEYLGFRVLGRLPDARRFEDCLFASTIWNEITFRNLHRVLASTHVDRSRFATLVHPAASVSARARLGQGVIVNFGASIAGNVTIDDHVSIGPGCIVGHDSIIDSYTCVAAGAVISGGVHVQRNCYVGSGAMVRQRIRIGEKALVGLGAVVVKDVDALATVAGNPARTISQRQLLARETIGVSK
jgi:sugar O-acyltransferase (sialic acid O-acetyltransferase NeuD family)